MVPSCLDGCDGLEFGVSPELQSPVLPSAGGRAEHHEARVQTFLPKYRLLWITADTNLCHNNK